MGGEERDQPSAFLQGSHDLGGSGEMEGSGKQGNGKPQGPRGLHPGTFFGHFSGKKAHRNQVGV